jgi:BirA family transcriptional regulator, biotin operon repressor / biotin---[acetyl-CoA-carboxylase] ligase
MQSKSEVRARLDLAAIEASLTTNWLGRSKCPNELWESIDSTNNRAIELGRASRDAGVIIIANQQTAGRGRSGNAWLSPANSGLYMSFLIKPNLALEHLPVITLITGVAVVRAIQSCLGIKVGLKWVNDLIVEGKKVGGILAEYVSKSTETNESRITDATFLNNKIEAALVIGIGLNLSKAQNLPPDLELKMGFLESFISNNIHQKSIDRNELVACVANELEIALEQMQSELELLLDQWRAHSITLGAEISAKVGNDTIIGQALDITDSGELIVKTIQGNITLAAGEISIRKADGNYA